MIRDKKVTLLIVLNLLFANGHVKKSDLIYVLMWTSSITEPFSWLDMDQDTFVGRKCLYQNCYITNDPQYFDEITDFDVLLFNVVNIHADMDLPQIRDPQQIYVFVGMQSSASYPVPETFNGYFNRTWTYKLDSDIYFGYIVVKDSRDQVIGPKKYMHWMDIDQMKPVTKYLKHKLRKKSVAAAWFVSNCKTNSQREDYVKKLKHELSHYGNRVDIYGLCGDLDCPVDRMDECFALLETDYYFYLAFENALAEDYITENVLFALEHFSVPIVYGASNYTRFMPDGIYLDAGKLGPALLAREMSAIIKSREVYYDFFKWRRYYSFHSTEESPETDVFCVFCALMNEYLEKNETSVYINFAQWWNGRVKWLDTEYTVPELRNLISGKYSPPTIIPKQELKKVDEDVKHSRPKAKKYRIPEPKKPHKKSNYKSRKHMKNKQQKTNATMVTEIQTTQTTTIVPSSKHTSATTREAPVTWKTSIKPAGKKDISWQRLDYEFEYDLD